MRSHLPPILVAGAGSWGTALAILLARNGQPTYLWGRNPAHIADLKCDHQNRCYLPGVVFPQNLWPVSDLDQALQSTHDLILAVPCAGLREVLALLTQTSSARQWRIAWACKGFEPGTHKLIHEVIEEMLGRRQPMAAISGPNFAHEVAAGLPAAVTVASPDAEFARDLVTRLHRGAFRAYTSDDIIGVEVGGAVKNVLAIAAGVADGLEFGANTRAALITRGLVEMIRIGTALNGRRETFMGLAGLGDLVLTCTDDRSRNRRLGLALAKGQTVERAIASIGQVVEGIRTAYEVDFLACKQGIEMPITEQVARLLKGECQPREAVQALLAREPKQELG